MDILQPPTDTPSFAPCSYVTVSSPNPLPVCGGWDEESVGDYAFVEWLDHDDIAEIHKPNFEGLDGDWTEYTADTEDDDSTLAGSEVNLTSPRDLVVYRRTNSSSSLSSIASTTVPPPRVTCTPALASFLQDRIHTFTSNLEVLATIQSTLGRSSSEEDTEGRSTAVARSNPLTRFVQARMHTFTSNVEMMSTVLAEQIEACLHLDHFVGERHEDK